MGTVPILRPRRARPVNRDSPHRFTHLIYGLRAVPSMSKQSYAKVVFNLPLDRTYTYSIPGELEEHVRSGVRVAVYLRTHLSTGYVVGMTDQPPDKEIKPVCDVLDSEPLFDEGLLKLTKWIADYYLCSWGQALDCALPSLQIDGPRRGLQGLSVGLMSTG